MQSEIGKLALILLGFVPAAVVISAIFWKFKTKRKFNELPFNDLLRRPAGEALRLKLEDLDEKLNENLTYLMLGSLMLVYFLAMAQSVNWVGVILSFAISFIFAVFVGVRLSKLINQRANYRLGYNGERFVGEELSRLIGLGFEIYHDVPFDGFNIDHVLVGPGGVFAVETKTRRKPVNEAGKREFRVEFDGQLLQWPQGSDSHGIEQAKNNAKTLEAWLNSAAGENIRVTPILTLPGWMVERKAAVDRLLVLNPKEIYQFCEKQPGVLTESQIRRLCHQLNQKCRMALH